MKREFRKRKIILLVLIVFLISTSLLIISNHILYKKNPAQWCKIQFPGTIYRDGIILMKIFYTEIETPTLMSLDLHGVSKSGVYAGFLRQCITKKITSKDGIVSASFQTNNMQHVSHIIPVITLSIDGLYKSRTHSAKSEPIPLYQRKERKVMNSIVEFKLYEIPKDFVDAKLQEGNNYVIKIVIIVLYFITLVLLLLNAISYTLKSETKIDSFNIYFWWSLTVCLLFVGLFSYPDIRLLITDIVRKSVQSGGWYSSRRIFQGIVSVLIISISAGLIILFYYLIKEKHWSYRIASLGTALLVIITLLRLLSFHTVDILFSQTVIGLRTWLLAETLLITSVMTGTCINIFNSKFTHRHHY